MPKWNSIQRGVTENMPEKPGTPVWASAVSRSLRGWLVGAGMGGKPKAVSRYALISISRIIRHRLRLHLARGHNHYHHHNHHHHRSSLSLTLSSVYMGHHRWNRCIKYFVCSDGKLHWNTNLQIQIDVALCQRSGHSDQSSPVPDTAPERPLGWAELGKALGIIRVLPEGEGVKFSDVSQCVLVCVCVENSKITWLHSAKKRRKNCWNVEIGLRLSWILNDERAAKGNGQGGVAGGNGARRCSNTVRVRSGNGHRVPRRARSPLTAAVWLVSVSLTPSLFEARGLLRVPACLGRLGWGVKGHSRPGPGRKA